MIAKHFTYYALVVAVVLGVSTQVLAEGGPDIEAGIAAYDSGDYETALNNLVPLAIKGNAEAQFRMAVMHVKGHGVSKNACFAIVWADKAARKNHPDAAYFMSFMYFGGAPIKPDLDMAYRWAAHSAKFGHHDGAEQREVIAVALTPERRSALDEEMKTWDATKQPAVEIFPFAALKQPYDLIYEKMILWGC
ncbi:tetratricopeptide repeat protein [Pseudomonadota bacterium]